MRERRRATDRNRVRIQWAALRALIPAVLVAGSLPWLTGCTRPPLAELCPKVLAGELVVSEVRGKQAIADEWGQWLEIYNRRDQPVALGGLRLVLRTLDGASFAEIPVRDRALEIPALGYVVLGGFAQDERPWHVQYGYKLDFDRDIPSQGFIELSACGALIDQALYRRVVVGGKDLAGLPDTGTMALDGARLPDAADNNDDSRWCNDDRALGVDGGITVPDGGARPFGLPGTPGARNLACK